MMLVRAENSCDFQIIDEIIIQAFRGAQHTDNDEHNLVRRLRASSSYIPELSLVAETEGGIVGHIAFSRISICSSDNHIIESLALAPVSVCPQFQNIGVGSALIREGHRIAAKNRYESVVVLGHPSYYPKFGYQRASYWGIRPPFNVSDEVYMAIELKVGALNKAEGVVKYPAAFGLF